MWDQPNVAWNDFMTFLQIWNSSCSVKRIVMKSYLKKSIILRIMVWNDLLTFSMILSSLCSVKRIVINGIAKNYTWEIWANEVLSISQYNLGSNWMTSIWMGLSAKRILIGFKSSWIEQILLHSGGKKPPSWRNFASPVLRKSWTIFELNSVLLDSKNVPFLLLLYSKTLRYTVSRSTDFEGTRFQILPKIILTIIFWN